MLLNYLKIAWRNLLRRKVFSFINIAGLAISLGCVLIIVLYVMDELSYDRHIPGYERIYRVTQTVTFNGRSGDDIAMSDMMGPILKREYAEVEHFSRIASYGDPVLVQKGSSFFSEKVIAHVDSTFFQVFALPALDGNPAAALSEPNTVVITAAVAEKYFGTTRAAGRMLNIREGKEVKAYKVDAVIRNIPQNTHFRYDMYFSMKNFAYEWGRLGAMNFYTYVMLKKGVDPVAFSKKFSDGYISRYFFPEVLYKLLNIPSMEAFAKAGNSAAFWVMPLADIHFRSTTAGEIRPAGNIRYVYIFSAIALFILLIACINFMNMTTALAAKRSREVGVRKALGTGRRELILQFLTESGLLAIVAFLLALGLATVFIPAFNQLTGKEVSIGMLLQPQILPLLLVAPLLTGLLAGSYPALFLSAFRPIEALKGRVKSAGADSGLRRGLVVFQFATSIVLIVGTLVVYQQLYFIQHKNLGYNKDQVLVINGTGALNNDASAFRNEVLQLPGVKSGTLSSYLPVSNASRNSNMVSPSRAMKPDETFGMQEWFVDEDYMQTMGMELLKGRGFFRDYGDKNVMIINEAAARRMGKGDPVGKMIFELSMGTSANGYTVVGVVKDFNYETLHQPVQPLGLILGTNISSAAFKITVNEHVDKLLQDIQGKWSSFAPGLPFSYNFLDKSFEEMYQGEQQVGRLALLFSSLAILIACLGIFGLATFMAEQRTREIGVRKVLGASAQSIVHLLNREFLRLVTAAFIIAVPVSWWMMNKWLADFEYRIRISWWVFAAAGATAIMIALFTVSFQSVKAALTNPVKSLRSE
ncbi:FtsX-like permease family protein [Chitinophaga sp. Mgbs1]|uniref:FtsX-like permease family protein n=1 Tax=Chitinophaga solisilvae TaxID=1233460 RepID=A0A3S1DMJ8_9BACT|nr:FtsX-like permease family protein [Chitinophaga solisilvae]